MHLAHKVQLQPTKQQEQYLLQACGISRLAYNIMLQRSRDAYECWQYGEIEDKPSISGYSLNKEFNKLKKLLMPYAYEVTKYAPQHAIYSLGEAFKKFFKGAGFPKFKKKKYGAGSYTMAGGPKSDYFFQGRTLKVPGSNKLGLLRTTQPPRFKGKICQVTISQHAGKWYAAISYEISSEAPIIPSKTKSGVVGVDLGIKELAVLSDGTVFENPRAYVRAQANLRKQNKSLSRKVKGSINWKRQVVRLQRAHKKVSDIRKWHLHNLSSHIAKNYDRVVIEDLGVVEMTKNRRLAKHVLDAGFYELRRQLAYKCELYHTDLVVVDRFFPSSKLCSKCGHKKEKLALDERTYNCKNCGLSLDRDLNAALNLKAYDTCASACGEESSGKGLRSGVKLSSMKQESSGMSV